MPTPEFFINYYELPLGLLEVESNTLLYFLGVINKYYYNEKLIVNISRVTIYF